MSPQKPFVSPPEPLNKLQDFYKIKGEPYQHSEIEINLASLKTIITTILLGVPYAGLILMLYSFGLKIIAISLMGAAVLIGGLVGLLYYLNREEPVKPPSNQNKRH